jgi:hypothetical protein
MILFNIDGSYDFDTHKIKFDNFYLIKNNNKIKINEICNNFCDLDGILKKFTPEINKKLFDKLNNSDEKKEHVTSYDEKEEPDAKTEPKNIYTYNLDKGNFE